MGGLENVVGEGNMVNCPTVVLFIFHPVANELFFFNLIHIVLLSKLTLMAQVLVVASMDIT